MASAKAAAGKFTLGRALQWDALASSPILQTLITNYYTNTHIHTYKDMHSPPHPSPDPSPPSLWTASLTSGSVTSAGNGCGTGWLLAGAGLLPLLQCHVSMVYVLLYCWGVFPVLTLYSPRSIVWGLFFFSSPSSCYAVFFFNSTCISLLIIPCMIVYVTNNKEPWTLNLEFFQNLFTFY